MSVCPADSRTVDRRHNQARTLHATVDGPDGLVPDRAGDRRPPVAAGVTESRLACRRGHGHRIDGPGAQSERLPAREVRLHHRWPIVRESPRRDGHALRVQREFGERGRRALRGRDARRGCRRSGQSCLERAGTRGSSRAWSSSSPSASSSRSAGWCCWSCRRGSSRPRALQRPSRASVRSRSLRHRFRARSARHATSTGGTRDTPRSRG